MVCCVYTFHNEIVLYLLVCLVFDRFYLNVRSYGESSSLLMVVPTIYMYYVKTYVMNIVSVCLNLVMF